MRMDGDNNNRGSNQRGSCSYVPLGADEILTVTCNEGIEREECRIFGKRFSRTEEEVLGVAYLGERVLCEHSWNQRGNHSTVHQETGRRRYTRGTAQALERRQRMTLSGVGV